ncbi:FAD-dependent thymidylate synthase [Candidatus Woesearchaeota archaeon]|nr:FAD-dependent thymidylate synthase [Candidatus Woesearchaeota archaeon]
MESRLEVALLRCSPRPEELVSLSAKLCYSHADLNDLRGSVETKDQKKFVDKLLGMGHLSPVEHVCFTFGVQGISRACTHQLVRHRVASYSQQSQRYVGEHSKKHEGGEEEDADSTFDFIIPPSVKSAGKEEWFKEKMQLMQNWYDELCEALGDSGESSNQDARFLLPNAAETKIIITMNARELMHFYNVRCCNRAQWEIRAMAMEMLKYSIQECPTIFSNAGPTCTQKDHSGKYKACGEGSYGCGKAKEMREMFEEVRKDA